MAFDIIIIHNSIQFFLVGFRLGNYKKSVDAHIILLLKKLIAGV